MVGWLGFKLYKFKMGNHVGLGDGSKEEISICAVFCKIELTVVDSSVARGFSSLRVALVWSELMKMSGCE